MRTAKAISIALSRGFYMRNPIRWTVALALVGALVLALAACGGGGSDDPTPAPVAAATTAPAPTTAPAAPTTAPSEPAPTQPAQSAQPFRIGVMESQTGPGETYGTVAVQAKEMAVDEINAAGGVNGRMIELVTEDSKCSAQDAIAAYRKLTSVDGVKIILGTSCSGAMLGAAPLAEEDGVILFSGLATNPDIANAGDYIFRTAMSDALVGVDTANTLWADGVRRLATITEATDYAEGVRRVTVESFEALGGTLAAEERYASDVTDFRSQLTKLLSENPDAIHIAAQSEFAGGTIVKQARELGYEGDLYSEVVPIGATALEIAGEAATGLKAITADLDPNNSAAEDLKARFRARYNYLTLPWYMGSAYDDVYIAAECLKRTGDDQDADGFRDCLYEITWSGAIGDNYGFDANGEVVGLANVVVEVLPLAERTDDNSGYRVLGQAPVGAPSGGGAMTQPAVAGEAFVIGVMESLTGAGETYGTVAVQAKEMALDEINAAGGIDGRKFEFIVEDSKCNAQDAITAYNKLTKVNGVKIILGTSCSGAMLGAAPLAEADGVILFSGLASNPDIANAGDYIFRTQISDTQVGIDTGNVLWTDGVRRLATITEATDYAEGVRRTSVAQFEKNGGEVAAAERYTSDSTDFRSQLTKLLGANPDAIHVAPQSEFSAGTIFKQAREMGYDGPMYAETVAMGTTSLEVAGDAATGVKAITADLDPNNPKAQETLAKFLSRYNYITLPWHMGSAYDDVYIAAECLRQTGDDQDADGFRDCMYEITWSGAIGDNYSFDANGEVVGLSRVVVEVLPPSERTEENHGYRVLGPAPKP